MVGADQRDDWRLLGSLVSLIRTGEELVFGYFANELTAFFPPTDRIVVEPDTELDWRMWVAPVEAIMSLRELPVGIPNIVMTYEPGWILDCPSRLSSCFLLGERSYRQPSGAT